MGPRFAEERGIKVLSSQLKVAVVNLEINFTKSTPSHSVRVVLVVSKQPLYRYMG